MSENKFKLLYISYYFPPSRYGGSLRSLKFVKYLQRNNWEITVISSFPNNHYDIDESLQKEIELLNIEIVRVFEKRSFNFLYKFDPIKRPRKIINRLLNYFSNLFFIPDNKKAWAKNVRKKTEELLSKNHFDVILISCPPFSVFSEIAKTKFLSNIPLVADYRDLWFGNFIINHPTPLHRMIHKKLEYNALKNTEHVIVSNRKIKEKLIKFFPFLTFESITIIENGFDSEDFDSIKSHPRSINKMVLMHYGDFKSYSSAKYFLKAFYQIKVEKPEIASNIELHFVGDIGKENRRLISLLNLHEFIINHGLVDYKDAIKKIISADILWFQIDDLKNSDSIVPSKLYLYFAARKPIIGLINDGASKSLLENYKAAYFSSPNDIKEIKSTILKVFENYKSNNLPTISEEDIRRFRQDLLIDNLLKILQSQVKIL